MRIAFFYRHTLRWTPMYEHITFSLVSFFPLLVDSLSRTFYTCISLRSLWLSPPCLCDATTVPQGWFPWPFPGYLAWREPHSINWLSNEKFVIFPSHFYFQRASGTLQIHPRVPVHPGPTKPVDGKVIHCFTCPGRRRRYSVRTDAAASRRGAGFNDSS